MQDLNIAGIRGHAAERIQAQGTSAQGLEDQRTFHQGQSHAAQFGRMERGPELHLPDHVPLLFQDRKQIRQVVGQEFLFKRDQFLGHEFVDHSQNGLHLF